MGFIVLPPEIIDRSCLYFIICIVSHKQVDINGDLDKIIICMRHISRVTTEHGSLMVGVWGTFLFVKKALFSFDFNVVCDDGEIEFEGYHASRTIKVICV